MPRSLRWPGTVPCERLVNIMPADGRVRARPDSDLVAAIVAHNGLTTAPVSATGETACIVPAHAVARANISRASFLPAAIPHRVIGVEERHERLPIIPIIKHPSCRLRFVSIPSGSRMRGPRSIWADRLSELNGSALTSIDPTKSHISIPRILTRSEAPSGNALLGARDKSAIILFQFRRVPDDNDDVYGG